MSQKTQLTKQQLLDKLAQTQQNLQELKKFFEDQKDKENNPITSDMAYDCCHYLNTSINWSFEIGKIINRKL